MNLQEDMDKLFKICKWRSGSIGHDEKYDKWVNENRNWLNGQLRKIGKRYRLIWNVRENKFVEVNVF